MEDDKNKKGRSGTTNTMFWIYIALLVLAIVFLVKHFLIITSYSIDPYIKEKITPHSQKVKVLPFRGAILAADGSYLALAAPEYNIFMDCKIRKNEFADKADKLSKHYNTKIAATESDFLKQTDELCDSLATIFNGPGERSAEEWKKFIIDQKRNGDPKKKESYGARHTIIRKNVNYTTYVRLKNAWNTAYNTDDVLRNGWIQESVSQENFVRHYPYGPLARRVIGSIPKDGDVNTIGIEGRYNKVLRGSYGYEYHKTIDGGKKILDNDSTIVKATDGLDILTTIDVNFQQIAHSALKREIEKDNRVWGGCAIVMEVETGAIRAMVNLQKNEKTGEILENQFEYATRRSGDPGSVFKAMDCMILLEDGKIASLDKKMPTHGGKYDAGKFNHTVNGKRVPYIDKDLVPSYLIPRNLPTDSLMIIDALKISSNNIFRELIVNYYGDDPQKYLDRIYGTGLYNAFDFDIDGLARPTLPQYGDPDSWSGPTLPTIAIGYSTTLTPLHVLTFYNAIANEGKMMRPYLVEGFMEDGNILKGFKAGNTGPGVLNAALCSKETAAEISRGLRKVVQSGTGQNISKAKVEVAGKTGTARILRNVESNGKMIQSYFGTDGKAEYQGTFVCFWPYEKPKYSAIMVTYSIPLNPNYPYYGASNVDYMKELVDKTCQLGVLNSEYGNSWPSASNSSK